MNRLALHCLVAGLIAALCLILAAGPAVAAYYYWDTNGATAGLGDTAGTWGTSAFHALVNAPNGRGVIGGTLVPGSTATTSADSMNFGTINLGLGTTASTIGIAAGGVTINNITFGFGQTNPVTLSGGGGTITLAGTSPIIYVNNSSDTIGAVLAGTAGLTKAGAGTLALTGANTYTGTTIVAGGGTLTVGNGTSGSLNGTTGTALTFNAGGGTFNVAEAAGSTQGMGMLTFSAGDGTVISTAAGASPTTATLTFDSLAARAAGATGNFVLAGNTTASENKIVLSNPFLPLSDAIGSNDAGIFFGGTEYARYDTTNGYFRAVAYGTDNNTLAALSGATMGVDDPTKDVKLNGNITFQTTASVNTINLAANTLTLQDTSQILSVNGILSTGGSIATAGTMQSTSAGGEMVFNVASGALSVAPAIQDNTSASPLTKSGAGTLTLSGTNTYTGTTRINAGTLTVSGGSAIADTGAVVLANAAGAILKLDASETIGNLSGGGFSGGVVDVQGNTLTLSDNTATTFGGTFTGTPAGAITKQGSGTFTLSNVNTFAGTINVNGGTLNFTLGNSGTTSAQSLSSGGAINMAGGTTMNFLPTAQVALGQNTGNNPSQLIAPNSWTIGNAITITSGTATFRFAQNQNRWNFTGGVTGGASGSQTLNILQGTPAGGGGDSQDILFSGVIADGSGGTLGVSADFTASSTTAQTAFINLSGQNTFTGPITVLNTRGLTLGAFLVIGGDRINNTTGITAGSGSLGTTSPGNGSYSNTISLATGTILDYASSANQTLGGIISGGGSILKEGSGSLTLSAANTYTGTTTVSGGTLSIPSIANAGTSSPIGAYTVPGPGSPGLSLSGGTLQYTGATAATDRGFVLGANSTIDVSPSSGSAALTLGTSIWGAYTLNVTGTNGSLSLGPVVLAGSATVNPTTANLTIASVAEIAGSRNLTKTGAGTLTLSGAGLFTGTTTISGGKIALGNASALQNSAYVTTGSTGAIGVDVSSLGATPLRLGGLIGAVDLGTAITGYSNVTGLTLNLLSASQTYSGIIGEGAIGMTLTKNGQFTQTLSGANSYTGTTTVNAGTLLVKGNQIAATGAVNVNNSAILGGTGTIGGAVTIANTAGINLTSDAAANALNLASSLSLTGSTGANVLSFDLGTATTDNIAVASTVSVSNPVAVRLSQIGQSSGSRLATGTYDLISAGSGTMPAATNFVLPTTKAFGQTLSLALDSGTSSKLQLTTTQVTAATAAAFWAGSTDANWSTAANWKTTVGGGIDTAGAPDYQTNVTFYTTTPPAAHLTDNAVDVDFDINSLTFNAVSGGVTIGGSKTITIEATNANGNVAGNGIIASAQTSGINTISANVALASSQSWNVGAGGTLTVSGNVTDLSGGGYTLKKIGAGTLNLNGTTTVGSMHVGVNVGSNGGGSLVVNSGGTLNVGIGASSSVGVGVNSTTAGATNMGTLDVSAGAFSANVGSFFVGVCAASGFGTAQTGSGGYVKLGDSNITATNFAIGGSVPDANSGANNGGQVTIASGKTANIITPVMSIGTSKATAVTSYLKLLGTGATLNLGNSSNRTMLTIGSNTSGDMQNKTWSGDMDLSAGTGNVYLNGLTLAINGFGGANANVTGTLELGSASNVLDISGAGSPVKIGYGNYSGYTTTGTATINNLASGSVINATDNGTAIVVAYKGGAGTVNGNLYLNGGTLTITTTGSAIAGGGGTSNLVLGNASGVGSGMTLKAGASSTAWIQNLTSATIKTTGVTFDTNGYNITVPQALLTDATDTGGGLTKTGAGTLTLSGANTYTGATLVSGGTLLAAKAASVPAFGMVTVAGGATLAVQTGDGLVGWSGTQIDSLRSAATWSDATAALGFDTTSGSFTYDSGISQTLALKKLGSNTLTLTGNSTYTGSTLVSAGTLKLAASSGSALTATSAVVNNATLEVGGATELVGAISGSGSTNVLASSSLTADSIVQNTLTIGAGGSVTIRETTGAGSASPVPEPGTWVLLGIGLLTLLAFRRRR